jgi:hypothetical protein
MHPGWFGMESLYCFIDEDYSHLECDAVLFGKSLPTSWRNLLHLSSCQDDGNSFFPNADDIQGYTCHIPEDKNL